MIIVNKVAFLEGSPRVGLSIFDDYHYWHWSNTDDILLIWNIGQCLISYFHNFLLHFQEEMDPILALPTAWYLVVRNATINVMQLFVFIICFIKNVQDFLLCWNYYAESVLPTCLPTYKYKIYTYVCIYTPKYKDVAIFRHRLFSSLIYYYINLNHLARDYLKIWIFQRDPTTSFFFFFFFLKLILSQRYCTLIHLTSLKPVANCS